MRVCLTVVIDLAAAGSLLGMVKMVSVCPSRAPLQPNGVASPCGLILLIPPAILKGPNYLYSRVQGF